MADATTQKVGRPILHLYKSFYAGGGVWSTQVWRHLIYRIVDAP